MANKAMASFLFGSVFLFTAFCRSSVGAVTCQQTVSTLAPCLPFLQGSGSEPSAPCCMGAQNLSKMASSTEIRRQVCKCLKKAASSYGVDVGRAKMIPEVCKVPVPVPVDPNVDCSKVP